MAGTSISWRESFFSWVWQNPVVAQELVQLLRNLDNSGKLEQFFEVVIAVAGQELHAREAESETNEILGLGKRVAA